MIFDAEQGPREEPPRYDLCVVGAGAAGITLALELEATGRRVCLLEAGGTDYEAGSQRLLEGEVAGDRLYTSLRDTRVAALGGSTTVWAGWCRPLEPLDFEPRDWCGGAAWPFGLDHLLPYYARAHAVCGLAEFDYDPERWSGLLGPRILDGAGAFGNEIFHVNLQDFGRVYRERLARSKTIDLVLHAPVTRLRMSGAVCAGAEVRTLGGRALTIEAERFVLAAGGVENPRLLLSTPEPVGGSTAAPGNAPGNAGGLVGRCFGEHAYVDPGTLVLAEPATLDFYRPRAVAEGSPAGVRGVLALRREVAERERLMHAGFFFHPRYEAHDAFASAEVKAFLQLVNKAKKRAVPGGVWPYARRAARAPHRVAVALARKLAVRHAPARRWRMRTAFETAFRPDNRVVLAEDRDRLGRRRARVEWRLGDDDIASMRRATALFDETVRAAGVGRLERAFPDEPSAWREAVEGGKHHMGTTRMHPDPRQGVVDADGLVHGTSNLYVTGSSVFPSGGFANPTLTIVALALRLGEHLRRELGRSR